MRAPPQFIQFSVDHLLLATMFSKELAALAGLICFTTAYPIDPPTPAAPNTAGDCSAWEVAFYDSTCEYIANNWLISVDDFTSWVSMHFTRRMYKCGNRHHVP